MVNNEEYTTLGIVQYECGDDEAMNDQKDIQQQYWLTMVTITSHLLNILAKLANDRGMGIPWC